MWSILKQIGVFLLQYWRYWLVCCLGCILGWILHQRLSPLPLQSLPQTQHKQSFSQNTTVNTAINTEKKKEMMKNTKKQGKITEKYNQKGILVEKTVELPTIISQNVKENLNLDLSSSLRNDNTFESKNIGNIVGGDIPRYRVGVSYNLLKQDKIFNKVILDGAIRIGNSDFWLQASVGKNFLSLGLTKQF